MDQIRVAIPYERSFLADREEAARLRQQHLDALGDPEQPVLVDLSAITYLTIASAQALLVDWISATRRRTHLVVVLITPHRDSIESIEAALRRSHEAAFWVTSMADAERGRGVVIGELTPTNDDVLRYFQEHGPAPAADYAKVVGLQATTASNRLGDLAGRGLLLRVDAPGRTGDVFVYPLGQSENGRPGWRATSRPRRRLPRVTTARR